MKSVIPVLLILPSCNNFNNNDKWWLTQQAIMFLIKLWHRNRWTKHHSQEFSGAFYKPSSPETEPVPWGCWFVAVTETQHPPSAGTPGAWAGDLPPPSLAPLSWSAQTLWPPTAESRVMRRLWGKEETGGMREEISSACSYVIICLVCPKCKDIYFTVT